MTEVTGGTDWVWVSVRGNHGGVVAPGSSRSTGPAGTTLQARDVARSYTNTVVKVNGSLAGTEGREPRPVRMKQLRQGVAEPELHLVPLIPDTERAAELMSLLRSPGAPSRGTHPSPGASLASRKEEW